MRLKSFNGRHSTKMISNIVMKKSVDGQNVSIGTIEGAYGTPISEEGLRVAGASERDLRSIVLQS